MSGAIGGIAGNNFYSLYAGYGNNASGSYSMQSRGAASSASGAGAISGAEDVSGADGVKTGECKTCAQREYVDGSNDAGVSFKTPTRVSPQSAASAVMSHEQEHVSREQSKADSEGREVVNQNVQIHMDVCPECGKSYVSGGTTTTTTAGKQQQKVNEPGIGQNFDQTA